jgi:hypothetical protein
MVAALCATAISLATNRSNRCGCGVMYHPKMSLVQSPPG